MAYKNKTIEEVYNILIVSFQEKFNQNLRILPKAFITILCKILAAVYIIPFKLCGWFYLQLFPDTASFEEVTVQGQKIRPLVKLGNLFGVGEPNSGKPWKGMIKITVLEKGRSLSIGTQLKSDLTGYIYCLAQNVVLENDIENIEVYCVESGETGVLANGSILNFVNPIGFVEEEAEVISTTQNGVDAETEAHYRNRVVQRYSTQPQGGALADYRIWANEVDGVLQAYPYHDEENPGYVLIYVSGVSEIYLNRIPTQELLVAVGKSCTYDPQTGIASRKPVTAILDPNYDETYTNVRSVLVTNVDVEITMLSGAGVNDFGEAVKKELEIYFNNREPYIRGLSDDNNRVDMVLRNSVIAAVNSVAVSLKASFGTATMRINGVEKETYQLGRGELISLQNLYINGVLYE